MKNYVSVRDHLLVGQLVGANFLSLEQVDRITTLTNVEVPNTEYLSSQA